MPLLVPEDGHADELVRHHEGLAHEDVVVLADLGQDLVGRGATERVRGLGGNRQRVDQRLWKVMIVMNLPGS